MKSQGILFQTKSGHPEQRHEKLPSMQRVKISILFCLHCCMFNAKISWDMLSSADNICKQFKPRSGPTDNVGCDLDPNSMTL